jgi:endonuclease/exonuclease/phosphatase family metal-dependent hydrolase
MKIATLNIYGGKHVERACKELRSEKLDALCLQEVPQKILPHIAEALKLPHYAFAPQWEVKGDNPYDFEIGTMGVATLLKNPAEFETEFYVGGPTPPIFDPQSPNNSNRVLLTAHTLLENQLVAIGNTHFTWSGGGQPTEEQHRDLDALLSLLKKKEKFILAGDLNAPNTGEVFLRLSNLLQDHVPNRLKTTIDQNLHRQPGIQLVVDALLTKGPIQSKKFKTVSGISDHIALLAEFFPKDKACPSL